jgi:hypothetical protein
MALVGFDKTAPANFESKTTAPPITTIVPARNVRRGMAILISDINESRVGLAPADEAGNTSPLNDPSFREITESRSDFRRKAQLHRLQPGPVHFALKLTSAQMVEIL